MWIAHTRIVVVILIRGAFRDIVSLIPADRGIKVVLHAPGVIAVGYRAAVIVQTGTLVGRAGMEASAD